MIQIVLLSMVAGRGSKVQEILCKDGRKNGMVVCCERSSGQGIDAAGETGW